MVIFDGKSSNAPVPGGNLAKPVLIALGALLVGRMFSGKSDDQEQPQINEPQDDSAAGGLGGLGSILGGLLGGVMGGSAGTSTTDQAGSVNNSGTDISARTDGGLGGLLDMLTKGGHADKVESWVGGGQNAPIEPEQLGNAIGTNTISDIARQAGVNEQDLLAELSKALPGIVDKLTANGQVPDMQELMKMLGQK